MHSSLVEMKHSAMDMPANTWVIDCRDFSYPTRTSIPREVEVVTNRKGQLSLNESILILWGIEQIQYLSLAYGWKLRMDGVLKNVEQEKKGRVASVSARGAL